MLQVLEISSMPEFTLLPYSNAEFQAIPQATRDRIVQSSQGSWVLMDDEGILMTVGVVQPTLIGNPPELWVLVADHFSANLRRNLLMIRDKVEDLLELYPTVRVRVEADYSTGERFANFFGFRKTKSLSTVSGRTYFWYEVN